MFNVRIMRVCNYVINVMHCSRCCILVYVYYDCVFMFILVCISMAAIPGNHNCGIMLILRLNADRCDLLRLCIVTIEKCRLL